MRKLYSAAFGMMALFVFPFATLAADENIVSLDGGTDSSELEVVTDHHFRFTTPGLEAGDVVTFLYTSDVDPESIGVDFSEAEFTEDEEELEASFSVQTGMEFSFAMLITENLTGGTYTVTAGSVANPSESIEVYPTATTANLMEANQDDYTRATTGFTFGDSEGQPGEGGGQCESQPSPDDLVEGTIDTVVVGDKVYVTWGEQEGAASYVVAYSLNENLTDPVTVETGITENLAHWVEDLDVDTTYYMSIRGDDEDNCQVGYANEEITTQKKAVVDQRMPKAEFKMPKKKRKKYKFNIKPELGEELEVVQRLEYQIFKGKKVKKAKRIGKKVRKQKNKNLGSAITVSGKNVQPGTFYWVRMRKVYKIDEEVVKTKYSKKKRLKTSGEKVVTE